jgi:predicted  nucleic acid-binding Zn-ribbon protein
MAESVEDELVRLRAEVESHRQRELEDLRSQLAAARAEADHFKREAYQVLANFRELEADDRAEFARLKSKIDTLQQLLSGRIVRKGKGNAVA